MNVFQKLNAAVITVLMVVPGPEAASDDARCPSFRRDRQVRRADAPVSAHRRRAPDKKLAGLSRAEREAMLLAVSAAG